MNRKHESGTSNSTTGNPNSNTCKHRYDQHAISRIFDREKISEGDDTMTADDDANDFDDQQNEEINTDNTWDKMYAKLLKFRAQHGHCRVPNRYSEDAKLGNWVSLQRWLYKLLKSKRRKRTSLTPERQAKLEKIGFLWSCQVTWKAHYIQLLEFVAINGHAQVPMKWEKDMKFAAWVSSQRRKYIKYAKGDSAPITEDQVNLLNAIGFVWKAERGGKKRKIEGNCVPVTNQALATVASPHFQQKAIELLESIGKKVPAPDLNQKNPNSSMSRAAHSATTATMAFQSGVMQNLNLLAPVHARNAAMSTRSHSPLDLFPQGRDIFQSGLLQKGMNVDGFPTIGLAITPGVGSANGTLQFKTSTRLVPTRTLPNASPLHVMKQQQIFNQRFLSSMLPNNELPTIAMSSHIFAHQAAKEALENLPFSAVQQHQSNPTSSFSLNSFMN